MEEEDSCRICRSGPEPTSPLYHPCKCTGSIRYCHQDCLVEWLQHSRKKHCELCNHPFIFHKKYRKDMPADGKLPGYLYLRRLILRSAEVTKLTARAVLVGITWLAILPYININVWRALFWSADVATWMMVPGSSPPIGIQSSGHNATSPSASNSSTSAASASSASPSNIVRTSSSTPLQTGPFANHLFSIAPLRAALKSGFTKLGHDIFEGQILSCVIVVLFVGIFLLREWILQNIPQPFEAQIAAAVAAAAPAGRHDGEAERPLQHDAAPLQPEWLRQLQLQDLQRIEENQHETPEGQQRHAMQQHPREIPFFPRPDDTNHTGFAEDDQNDADALELRRSALAFRQSHLDPQLQEDEERRRQEILRALSASASSSREAVLTSAAVSHDLGTDPDDVEELRQARLRRFQDPLASDFDSAQVTEEQVRPGVGAGLSSHCHDQSSAGMHKTERETAEGSTSEFRVPTERSSQPSLTNSGWDSSPHQSHGGPSYSAVGQDSQPDHAPPSQEISEPETAALQFLPETRNNADDERRHDTSMEDDWEDQSTNSSADTATRRADDPFFDEEDDDDGEAQREAEFPGPILGALAADRAPLPALRFGAGPAAANAEADANGNGNININFNVDAAALGGANAAGANEDGNLDDPEAEAGFAEEMDGILEAVGMRGPLFNILQNLCLMIFLCTFVMLVFVALPYVAGKLLGSGPRLIKLLALPIKLLRLVTDPIFDFLIGVGAKSLWPKLASLVGFSSSPSRIAAGDGAAVMATKSSGFAATFWPSIGSFSARKPDTLINEASIPRSHAPFLASFLPASVTGSAQWKSIGSYFELALTAGFEGTSKSLLAWSSGIFESLDAHTTGTSSVDRAICVAFGHAYWLLILFVHRLVSKPNLQQAIANQSALKIFMDQHVLIIKVISFIFIELIVFPFGCGLLFDVCIMPMFADASIFQWPDRIRYAPFTFAFTRWMGGTIYMFIFAQYVSATRKVLRSGVLCWIRDPNDPSFHPIKEILDKKSLTQLKKIGASALMYAGILIASVGVNTYLLRYVFGFTGILPLRWQPLSPLTEIPLDLIAVHMIMPWAMQQVDPDVISEKVLQAWWRGASRMLRLSAYFMGVEAGAERKRVQYASWKAWLTRGRLSTAEDEAHAELIDDGGMYRVPEGDKAIFSGPLIIPLNPDATPADDRAAEAIAKQEEEGQKQKIKPTYQTLYLPSHYQIRIRAILTLLWLSHSALFMLGLSVPLSIGRAVSALVSKTISKQQDVEPIHDFYSLLLGIVLMATGVKLARVGLKLWRRSKAQARRLGTSRSTFILAGLARKSFRLLKAFVLLLGVAGIAPFVVGLIVDQYVVVPLRYASWQVPVMQPGQTWAVGLIEMRLIMFMIRFLGVPSSGPLHWFMEGADQVIRGGVLRPRLRVAYARIVLPILGIGCVLLISPVIAADVLSSKGWVPVGTREEEAALLRKVVGLLQSAILIGGLRAMILKRMESWTDLLKDEVFLESTELKNYEDTGKAEDAANGGTGGEAASRGGRDEYQAEGPLPDVMFR